MPLTASSNPKTTTIGKALRARFVEGCSTAEAAKRFGYAHGSFRNLCSSFLKDCAFFRAVERKRQSPREKLRILELRKDRNFSIHAGELQREGTPLSATSKILKKAGLPRLPRRSSEDMLVHPEVAPLADRRELSLEPCRFRTGFGGLSSPFSPNCPSNSCSSACPAARRSPRHAVDAGAQALRHRAPDHA